MPTSLLIYSSMALMSNPKIFERAPEEYLPELTVK
jgi:hypothetical protein